MAIIKIIHKVFRQQLYVELVVFTSFLRNNVYAGRKYVCSFVRLSVHASFTISTIIYHNQSAGARSVSFCTHMHVDKVLSSANFHSHPSTSLTFIFKVKIRIEYIGKFIRHMRSSLCRHDGLYQDSKDSKGCQAETGWYNNGRSIQSIRRHGGIYPSPRCQGVLA